jgi:hypothetical protein
VTDRIDVIKTEKVTNSEGFSRYFIAVDTFQGTWNWYETNVNYFAEKTEHFLKIASKFEYHAAGDVHEWSTWIAKETYRDWKDNGFILQCNVKLLRSEPCPTKIS